MKDQREINQRIIKRLQQESERDNANSDAILYLIAVLAFIFFINALLNAF